MNQIEYSDFEKVDIRVGKITDVEDFPRAKNPSYRLTIDFGDEIGVKRSAGQYKNDYTPEQLLGSQCIAVVNLEPRNIAGFMSEVLVLGVPRDEGGLAILRPADKATVGGRMY